MSNAIRYDSLLVRALAAELDAALSGARLTDAFLERDRLRVGLRTRAAGRGQATPPSLLWQLHPSSGHLTRSGADTAAGGQIQLATASPVMTVTAPPDERILVIELDAGNAPAGIARRIVIELITNQWNAIAVGADNRIVAVLRERTTKDRQLRAGVEYRPPAPSGRRGVQGRVQLAEWLDALNPVPPADRVKAVLGFAYTGPVNAAAILGDAVTDTSTAALQRAHDRYTALVHAAPPGAFLIQVDGRWQPYPAAIGGTVEPMLSLLAAFEAAAEREAAGPSAEAEADVALEAVARRMHALNRRAARLRSELTGAASDAQRLRVHADLLLAQLQRVSRGADSIELDDFAGGTIQLELDPTLTGAENATRLYDAARRRDRAAARIPRLLSAADTELVRLEALAGRIRTGAASPAELERLRSTPIAADRGAGPVLPYREYRTSSGIEIRVGRGSKANDDLTFRHSRPSDIWLHARDVAGAHVILRWPQSTTNPAAADIAEAAVLAALHSRARTSGLVAVDWTRRKYVRKPRKAGPGLVIPERVRTVFVEPDPRLDEKLRVDSLTQDQADDSGRG